MSEAAPLPPALSWRAQAGFALLFFGFVLLSRAPTFFRSVLDWDESLYFLMAAQWRAGYLPYTTIWDNKPLGIYAIFALFQAIFGIHVVAMRLASTVFVTLGACAVFGITYVLARPAGRAALFCAGFAGFAFCLCALSNDGLSSNTELFMAAFTALAVLAALSPEAFARRRLWQGLAVGAGLGAAFMTKYVAVFEAPAVLLLLLLQAPARDAWRISLALILGASLPVAAAILLYWHAGQLPVWWSASIASNFRRFAPPIPPGAAAWALGQQACRWGTLYAAAGIMLILAPPRLIRACRARSFTAPRIHHVFLACWLAGGLIGASAAKSFYDHYFLQLLPVLCVTAGWLLAWIIPHIAGLPYWRFGLAVILAGFLTPPAIAADIALCDAANPVIHWQDGRFILKPDAPARIAEAISTSIALHPSAAQPQIYVFDAQPIIYALTRQTPPTRYALPSVLTGNFLSQVAGVDGAAEVARILAENPVFIVRYHRPPNRKDANQAVYAEMDQALAARYRLWRSDGGMDVYRHVGTAGPEATFGPAAGR